MARACARHGVHYVDITPEPHFVARIVKECVFVDPYSFCLVLGRVVEGLTPCFALFCRYDYMAFKTNALIIPACGFDSIPPDIAVFVSNRYVKAVLGPQTSIEDSVTAYDVQGGFSGGSTDSIISFVEDVPRKTLMKSAADYVLRQREFCGCFIHQRLTVPARSSRTSQSPPKIRVQAPI